MNNTLVMLLSTFNSEEIKKSIARDELGNEYHYYHQMEPVPRMLKERENLDTIVALCTKETFDEKELKIGEERKTISAVNYFKEVLSDVDVKCVLVDANNPAEGIIKATDEIRSLRSQHETGFNLWVDIHGGFRSLQTTFQVIISLLEKEGISSKKNYTVVGKDGKYEIKEEKQSFDINYLFAGMNEFFNTGKADMLAKFLSGEQSNENNVELVNIIDTISDAIQLCDIDSFDAGCDKMAQWLQNRETDGSYIDIFVEYFKADYGRLLDKKKGITSRIEWCVDKDYIQQALTIIESKMPKKIYNAFIKCSNMDDQVQVGNETRNVRKLVSETKPRWESIDNYLVMKYAFAKVLGRDENDEIEYLNLREDIEPLVNDTINNSQMIDGGLATTLSMNWRNVDYEIKVKYQKDDSTQSMFKLFLQLHMTLKNQRNSAAHGASGPNCDRIKAEDVKKAIRAYLKLARALNIK